MIKEIQMMKASKNLALPDIIFLTSAQEIKGELKVS